MIKKYNITKKFLIKEYIKNKKSIRQITKELKCNSSTVIFRYLKKYKIKPRTRSKARKDKFKGKTAPNFKDGRTLKKYFCKDCSNEISIYSALYGEGRCRKCFGRLIQGENSPHWNNGSSFEPYPLGWTKIFKEQIRYRDGYKCQICGCPEIECNRKLSIHHIDYDKENLDPNNLISLCNSCHTKTNGNRKEWKEFLKI